MLFRSKINRNIYRFDFKTLFESVNTGEHTLTFIVKDGDRVRSNVYETKFVKTDCQYFKSETSNIALQYGTNMAQVFGKHYLKNDGRPQIVKRKWCFNKHINGGVHHNEMDVTDKFIAPNYVDETTINISYSIISTLKDKNNTFDLTYYGVDSQGNEFEH